MLWNIFLLFKYLPQWFLHFPQFPHGLEVVPIPMKLEIQQISFMLANVFLETSTQLQLNSIHAKLYIYFYIIYNSFIYIPSKTTTDSYAPLWPLMTCGCMPAATLSSKIFKGSGGGPPPVPRRALLMVAVFAFTLHWISCQVWIKTNGNKWLILLFCIKKKGVDMRKYSKLCQSLAANVNVLYLYLPFATSSSLSVRREWHWG